MIARDYQIEAHSRCLATNIGKVIHPTGSGKSRIQGMIVESYALVKPSIVVILTPRIALTNQLAVTVSDHLYGKKVKFETVAIHSGANAMSDDDLEDEEADQITQMQLYKKLKAINYKTVTKSSELATRIFEAKLTGKTLLICSTYHSSDKVSKALRVIGQTADHVLCDEAHYIVEFKFHDSVKELKNYTSKIHFFTATEKHNNHTDTTTGTGMQNEAFYGPVISRRTPRELIEQGYILAPRIHLELAPSDVKFAKMVESAFAYHQSQINYNAKLLVCCNGVVTVKEIAEDSGFVQWCANNDVTVFRISSADGAWINNQFFNNKERSEFFRLMRAHTGKAIVLHINILTEGIDVPDFSGVMFLRNAGQTRFLQSIGRAMRRHANDANKTVEEFDQWLKKYAFVILAERDDNSEDQDKNKNIKTMIQHLRDANFDVEKISGQYDRGEKPPVVFDDFTKDDPNLKSTFSKLFQIIHEIEDETEARLVAQTTASLLEQMAQELGL
jgi:superfamily II DNA or RNA helicase